MTLSHRAQLKLCFILSYLLALQRCLAENSTVSLNSDETQNDDYVNGLGCIHMLFIKFFDFSLRLIIIDFLSTISVFGTTTGNSSRWHYLSAK